METFQLALFPFFSFDAAKLLRHTAKTCQYLEKNAKNAVFHIATTTAQVEVNT